MPREHFKYFFTPKESTADLFFLPYWRFRGMVFSFDALSIESKIIDTNILALKPGSAPMSLGLRPQVLKLRYVAPGIAGNFLKPQFPFRKHVNCGPENERSPIKPVSPGIEASFVGETESLIYSPFSIHDNVLVDAVLQSPVGNAGWGPVELPAERCDAEDQLSFLPMMCPTCGWDLEGEKNSLVLFCRNCAIAWQSGGSGFENVKFAFPAAKNGGDAAVYLPFWRLNASVTGLQLRSYADLARLANLPKGHPECVGTKATAFLGPGIQSSAPPFSAPFNKPDHSSAGTGVQHATAQIGNTSGNDSRRQGPGEFESPHCLIGCPQEIHFSPPAGPVFFDERSNARLPAVPSKRFRADPGGFQPEHTGKRGILGAIDLIRSCVQDECDWFRSALAILQINAAGTGV